MTGMLEGVERNHRDRYARLAGALGLALQLLAVCMLALATTTLARYFWQCDTLDNTCSE